MRAFTIKAKTLDSAQSLFDALRRFDPVLALERGYSVSVDVGESDRRILEVLDAIHEHVEKGHSLTRVELDGRHYTHQPDRHVAASAASAHRKMAMHRHGRTVIEWFDSDRVPSTSSMIARPSRASSLAGTRTASGRSRGRRGQQCGS